MKSRFHQIQHPEVRQGSPTESWERASEGRLFIQRRAAFKESSMSQIEGYVATA
jgi:hypothetical protein